MKKYYKGIFVLSLLSASSVYASSQLTALTDIELSEQTGQALLNLGYTNPSGTGNGSTTSDFGFYKLGLEGKLELNANIKSLQLGCGGRNGPGVCDIDMSNVSLSGPSDSIMTSKETSTDGTPIWSVGRPNTSAVITNPFLEFAIKNPGTAATREIVGFRFSAEEILGYLSAGTANVADPTDGIKTFSGFLKVAKTPVNAYTEPAMFGVKADQMIYANVGIVGGGLGTPVAFTNPNAMTPGAAGYKDPNSDNDLKNNLYKYKYENGKEEAIWGINVGKQNVSFAFPETIVSGNRMSQLNLVVNDVPIPTIAIGAKDGGISMTLDKGVLGTNTATFFMGAKGANCAGTTGSSSCSYITNLKANVAVKQNFNLIHNLPISSGGYLSLQNAAIKWPGSDAADTSQPGWWLSFKDPLDFGELNPTTGIDMKDVLPQISSYITDFLSKNTINLGLGDALGALFGAPLYKSIGNIQMGANDRAVMTLENLLLDGRQKPVSNCFGNLKFC